MIGKLLAVARMTTVERMAELRVAVETGDSDKIRFAAHTIKGGASTLFAVRLAKLAAEIEAASEDVKKARALIPELEAGICETIDWWKGLEAGLAEKLP